MKVFIKLLPAALAVISLASCSNDNLFGLGENEQPEGSIRATIVEVGETRAAMAVANDGTRTPVFSTNDVLNIYSTESVNFDTYTNSSTTLTNQADFVYSATTGSQKFDLTDGKQYIGVVKNFGSSVTNTRIYGVSASANGPELTMQIPGTFDFEQATTTLNGKDYEAYKMPLPLWGEVNLDANNQLNVALNYLTGFLKIDVTNLRAGSKAIKITADKPISGFFNATLDAANPANSVLATDEALTSSTKMIVILPQANVYEGISNNFYVPIIANQTYNQFKIDVYRDNACMDLLETIYDYNSATGFQFTRGRGRTIASSMTVYSNATTGLDLSSKLYELTHKNVDKNGNAMAVTLEAIQALAAGQTIYIDKNATNDITLKFRGVLPNGLKIVEGTPTNIDANGDVTDPDGNVTWSTETTTENSESAAKKHSVKIVYNNQVNNTGNDVFAYLPYATVTLAGADLTNGGAAAQPFDDNLTILSAKGTNGGDIIIDESAKFSNSTKILHIIKDGNVIVNGFVDNLDQQGNGDVTINNLNTEMTTLTLGAVGNTVTGNVTVNGLEAATTRATSNQAFVKTLDSYSTGQFQAIDLDGTAATSAYTGAAWTFHAAAADDTKPIVISNNTFNPILPALTLNAKSNLEIDNVIITAYAYIAHKKATVKASNRAAIKGLTGDTDDMLSISSEWAAISNVGIVAPAAATVTTTAPTGVTAQAVANVVNEGTEQIHTAYQLASLSSYTTTFAATAKATTTMDMKNINWTPLNRDVAVSINGNRNSNSDILGAKILNLKNVPATDGAAGSVNGLFGTISGTAAATIQKLVIDGVDFEKNSKTGALIGNTITTGAVAISNVKISGATLKSVAIGEGLGGLIGAATSAITLTDIDLQAAEISTSNQLAGGVIGTTSGNVTASGVKVNATKIGANDIAGGLIASVTGTPNITLDKSAATGEKNEITIGTLTVSMAGNGAACAGGLIGYNAGATVTAKNTIVDITTLNGSFYLGGMIGYNAGAARFGHTGGTLSENKDNRCEVSIGTIALTGTGTGPVVCTPTVRRNNPTTKAIEVVTVATRRVDAYGSVSSYVGYTDAAVTIYPYCKHGSVFTQTQANKTAMKFKDNIVVVNDGVNENYWFFYGGNAWVGMVNYNLAANNIKVPAEGTNVLTDLVNGQTYNVRKLQPQFVSESFSDWDE